MYIMVSATFNSDSNYQYWRADKAMQLSYVCTPVSIVCGVRTVILVTSRLPPRRGLVHSLRMREIIRSFSVKSFVDFLVRMRKIILTKNTELSLRYMYTLATI